MQFCDFVLALEPHARGERGVQNDVGRQQLGDGVRIASFGSSAEGGDRRRDRRGGSYGQFCGLARSLDAVGDRWSLLIVRELLLAPMRYSELAAALDGIATNLLADRLRSLQNAGVIERRVGATGGVVYALTPWGAQLRETVESLVRWSAPLMIRGRDGDVFEPRRLAVGCFAAELRDARPRSVLRFPVSS